VIPAAITTPLPGHRAAGRLASVEEAVASIARGEMVVVVDSKDRENEGDLVMAAERVTPEAVNFMAAVSSASRCSQTGSKPWESRQWCCATATRTAPPST